MNKFITTLLLSILISINVNAESEISKEKMELVDKLLEQTGQSAIAMGKHFSNSFTQQMTLILKQTKPEIDPKAFEILEEEITSIIEEELVEKAGLNQMLYPIYDRHFTTAELTKMIELNNTEFGRKMIKVMPLITLEGMQAGQKFGQMLAPKIQQRLAERFRQEGIE